MAKYYIFRFNAGYIGTDTEAIVKFNDDMTEDDVEESFEDWYANERNDSGGFEEISEEEAERLGIDEDYSDEED